MCSLRETGLDDGVEKLAEEGEPLRLLDFAITVGVEAVKELLDLPSIWAGSAILLPACLLERSDDPVVIDTTNHVSSA